MFWDQESALNLFKLKMSSLLTEMLDSLLEVESIKKDGQELQWIAPLGRQWIILAASFYKW